MKVEPLKRVLDRPVGIVVGPRTVRGEWGGNGAWERVPANAVLYTPSQKEVWPLVVAGQATARRWKAHGIVSVDYGGRKIINLRGQLNDLSTPDKLATVIEWVDFFRAHGANVGSPNGMNWSLWRSTLTRPVVEYGKVDAAALALGGRQDYLRMGHFEHVELWDLTAAYASTIGALRVPRKWKHYSGPGWNELAPDGFARAIVHVPRLTWGPLPTPAISRGRVRLLATGAPPDNLRYPVDQTICGVWSHDELREAVRVGCDVEIIEYWVGVGARPVFSRWWDLILEARMTLSEPALRLVKWSANSLWGRFAANGNASIIWYEEGVKHREKQLRAFLPQSLTIAGLVTGRVRARLYQEALSAWDFLAIACHTDGVWLPAGINMQPNDGEPGSWRIRKGTDRLMLLGPQTYRYDQDGSWRYVMAGVPDTARERIFTSMAGRYPQMGDMEG